MNEESNENTAQQDKEEQNENTQVEDNPQTQPEKEIEDNNIEINENKDINNKPEDAPLIIDNTAQSNPLSIENEDQNIIEETKEKKDKAEEAQTNTFTLLNQYPSIEEPTNIPSGSITPSEPPITPLEPPKKETIKPLTPGMKPSNQPKGNSQPFFLDKGSKIPRYPYNGKSKHLIEKIYIIGYERNNLKKLLEKQKDLEREKISRKEKEKEKEKEEKEREDKEKEKEKKKALGNQEPELKKEEDDEGFEFDEKPVILSEVSSNYDQIYIDNDTVVDLIFPNYPKIYEIKQKEIQSEEESNIVFSFNIPLESNGKTSNNFYAYIYYDSISLQGLRQIVVPFAICILSEYPYFANYRSIAESLKKDVLVKVPREIVLYNLVNFVPSPINCSIGVKLYPDLPSTMKDNFYFKQLSGYPLFQFDLTELFNILPIEVIIQIFFFTFLENDMIFFSENLEILNIVMFIFANLNYPLNDSTYFFHILSVSLETFMSGTSPFVTKTFSSLFGINASYNSKINTVSKKQEHFIVDLENKEFLYKYNEARIEIKDDVVSNVLLLNYISSAMKGQHTDDFLGQAINELYKELELIAKKVTHRNINNDMVHPEFFKGKLAENQKNYNSQLEIMEKMNKQIQEHFYVFTLKILSKFFNFYQIDLPKDNNSVFNIDYREKKDISNIISNNKAIEDVFIKKFKDCSKFNTYIANFIQNNDSIDLFKIPLLFAEEFIIEMICIHEQSKHQPEQTKEILLLKPFETIDNFYEQCELSLGVLLDFDVFYKQIVKTSPQIFEEYHLLDLVEYFRLSKEAKLGSSSYEKLKEINDITVFKYILFLNNLDDTPTKDKLHSLFPCLNKSLCHIEHLKTGLENSTKDKKDVVAIKQEKKESTAPKEKKEISKSTTSSKKSHIERKRARKEKVNEFTKESPSLIQEVVEKNILYQKQMTRNDLIVCSFFYLFIITRKIDINEGKEYLDMAIELLKLKKNLYSFRKCVTLLVILFYEIIKQKNEKGIDANKEKVSLKKMMALIREENIIPNEELILYLNDSVKQGYADMNKLANYSTIEGNQFIHIHKHVESLNSSNSTNANTNSNPNKQIEKSDSSEINNNSSTPGQSASPSNNKIIQSSQQKSKNYLQYNLGPDGVRKYTDFFLKLSENILFLGDLTLSSKVLLDPTPKDEKAKEIKTDSEHKTIWAVPLTTKHCCYTFIFSTMKLYNITVDMQKSIFRADLAFEPEYEKLKNITCNLIFYVENINNLIGIGYNDQSNNENINAIKESMLEFLYCVLNSIPKEKMEITKYHAKLPPKK